MRTILKLQMMTLAGLVSLSLSAAAQSRSELTHSMMTDVKMANSWVNRMAQTQDKLAQKFGRTINQMDIGTISQADVDEVVQVAKDLKADAEDALTANKAVVDRATLNETMFNTNEMASWQSLDPTNDFGASAAKRLEQVKDAAAFAKKMADYQSQKAISEWSEKELNEASIAASRIANSAPDVPSRDKNGNPTGRSTLVGTYTNSDGSVTAYGQSLGIQQMRSNNTQSNTPYSDAIANAVGLDPRELRAPASNDGGSRAVGAGTGDLY